MRMKKTCMVQPYDSSDDFTKIVVDMNITYGLNE
jgi:hypothetical protein